MAFPIDLVDVSLDGGRGRRRRVAHVVARSRGAAAGWRGPVLAVMNAEFIGDWDVAPRGHPNDGRVETLRGRAVDVGPSAMGVAAAHARRARTFRIPQIATRSVRSATFDFDVALRVRRRRCRRRCRTRRSRSPCVPTRRSFTS